MNALILSAILGVVMMFSGLWLKQKSIVRSLAIAGVLLLLLVNVLETSGIVLFKFDWNGMLHFDRFSLLFNSIVFAITLLYFILSSKDMEKVGINYAEYFALIFFILCGIVLAVSFKSLLILFLGIEIMSIPMYILTGAEKRNLKSNEASLKYFLQGAFSTGIMLMGIAFIYGDKGSFQLDAIAPLNGIPSALLVSGMLLMLFAMSFKSSVAPFHFWAPDVYDGAPTVFASFMATLVKGAVFVAFIRLFDNAFGEMQKSSWQLIIGLLTVVTLIIGNITAVFQQSVKRMLAYSSIAQAGFMLLSIYAMNTDGKLGLLLYVAAYSLATIGIFAVLAKMKDYTFEGFNGLAEQQPVVAFSITIFILSLAGVPLTAGFLSKFLMLKAALLSGSNTMWLVIIAVLMAAVSVYYYFRVIQAMYFKKAESAAAIVSVSPVFKWTLLLMAALLIALGLFPNLLFGFYYF
ncbi:MAG: NADH-quinone oxidoreductase subunit N [Bacteroidetes bacterium]|nr:NADH-quinone oxidoreductase subunit N [Bacteroidota bacterium]